MAKAATRWCRACKVTMALPPRGQRGRTDAGTSTRTRSPLWSSISIFAVPRRMLPRRAARTASRAFGAVGSAATLTGVKVSAGATLGSDRASLTSPLARAWRCHVNGWLGLMPRCRATCDTEWPGRQASSTSWSFSSSLHRRRRSGPVKISTRPLIALASSRTTMRMTRR